MKRTIMIMSLVGLLGIGCGFTGVFFGGLLPYPEAPDRMNGDAIRASILDATLHSTRNWILKNYRIDRERERAARIELKLEYDESADN